MFGRITKEEALQQGYTHHGSYYGIPVWITDEAEPHVAVKFEILDYAFDFVSMLEWFVFSTLMGDEYGGETIFTIKDPIQTEIQ